MLFIFAAATTAVPHFFDPLCYLFLPPRRRRFLTFSILCAIYFCRREDGGC